MRVAVLRRVDFYLGNLLCVMAAPFAILLGRLLRIDHELRPPKSVVVLKLLGGGNLAMNAPFFLGLRRSHPNARITLVTLQDIAPFAATFSIFDRILVFNVRNPVSLFISSIRILCQIFRSDCLVELEIYSKLTTFFALLSCARNRIGFFTTDFFIRRALHTHTVFFREQEMRLVFFEQILNLLGGTVSSWVECREHLRAFLGIAHRRYARQLCLGPFCSDNARERQLTADQWRELFKRRLISGDIDTVVILGSQSDRAMSEQLAAVIGPVLGDVKLINTCGDLSLSESVKLLGESGFYWGIDSALLHYARLLGIPTLSIWGPTDPRTRLSPIDQQIDEVIYRAIPCSPCVHLSESPPCEGRNICMRQYFDSQPLQLSEILVNITSYPKRSND